MECGKRGENETFRGPPFFQKRWRIDGGGKRTNGERALMTWILVRRRRRSGVYGVGGAVDGKGEEDTKGEGEWADKMEG